MSPQGGRYRDGAVEASEHARPEVFSGVAVLPRDGVPPSQRVRIGLGGGGWQGRRVATGRALTGCKCLSEQLFMVEALESVETPQSRGTCPGSHSPAFPCAPAAPRSACASFFF